jgi:hypothetical protein
MTERLVRSSSGPGCPALIAAAADRASQRFLQFFATNIRDPHTRRAYGRAVVALLAWWDENRTIDHQADIAATRIYDHRQTRPKDRRTFKVAH